ncbi:hypothetical protein, partial [Streptomyces aurantiacus]
MERGARRLVGAGVTAVAALLTLLLCAPGAAAGGPTSVLLTSPESAETASLHHGQAAYGELETLLGPTTEGESEQPPGLSLGATRQINVTWLAHDVHPWRVDRVYPEPSATKDASTWIHTTTDPETMSGYWHRSPDPSALRALLKDLGLMGKVSERNHAGIRPSAAAAPGAGSAADAEGTKGTRSASSRDSGGAVAGGGGGGG